MLKNHFLIIILFLGYIFFSIASYQTYGISYDEQNVYLRANATYKHMLTNDTDPNISYGLLFQSSPQDVNVFYNNTYSMILRIFNPRESYQLYHLYNLLFSSIILVAAYVLLYSIFKNQYQAIIAPFFIIFTPIFFGHIPINPKDMPFAVFYFLSLVAIYISSKNKSLLSILSMGILFGLTQSGRIIGFTLYPILGLYHLYLSYDEFKGGAHRKIMNFFFNEGMYLFFVFLGATFFMVITWPYLGSNFLKHFINLFLISKSFPWDGAVLYRGVVYSGAHLPLSYIPHMFFIQTPLFIISLAGSSLLFFRSRSNRLLVLLWLSLIINLLLYLGLKPISLLRHYLFIFPILATMAAVGYINTIQFIANKNLKAFFVMIVFISVSIVGYSMIKLFPYEYIYFNEFVGGKNAQTAYSIDDWAQSNKEATLWLANYTKNKQDTSNVYICGNNFTGSYFFPSWLHIVDTVEEADFAICGAPVSREDQKVEGKIIHTIERDGIEINRIYQI